jgi:hypothetical protein
MTQNRCQLSAAELGKLRTAVLERDRYKCVYCAFQGDEWQTVCHLDGDPGNNKISNLATLCPMCNLVMNTRLGCQVEGIVELYQLSKYDQNKIVQLTRKMRSEGKSDDEIIRTLGLKVKMPFKMNRKYLNGLYAFVTSWKGSRGEFDEALAYGYGH